MINLDEIFVSIVIPLYNKQETVVQTLYSVLNQSFSNYEVIIVDDGSTDDSLRNVKTISDKRIRILSQTNQGVSAARNTGIKVAKYPFITFIDADDTWNKDYLQTVLSLYQSYPSCSVFATRYAFKYVNGEIHPIILNRIPFRGDVGIINNYFEVAYLSHPPIWTGNVLIKKDALIDVGGFPEGSIAGEDLLTWAKLAVKYKIAYNVKQVEAYFHVVDESLKDTPKRVPAKVDKIGMQLLSLYMENHQVVCLRKYLSHWHKMRSSMFMRIQSPLACMKEAFVALRYNPFNYKVILYIILSFMPTNLRQKLLR